MNNDLKVLIIHITDSQVDAQRLRDKLDTNPLFPQYYDGFECTGRIEDNVIISTRYYYYDIAHEDLLQMIRHLNTEGTEFHYKIKINPQGFGGHQFD